MFVVRVPKPWKYFVTISVFLLLAYGCSVSNGSTPTVMVTDQVQVQSPSVPESTRTPVPPNTPIPTFTITSNMPTETAGEITATQEKKTYPQVSPSDLFANPDDYVGKRFLFDGVVLSYGYRKYEGKDVYIIQVGVIDYPRPIIVLDFLPNPTLGIHDGIVIGGTGGGAYYGIDPTDPKSFTPVIHGEWYECNLLWDQWKYPYEFWDLIKFDTATIN